MTIPVVTVELKFSEDPPSRILAIETVAKAICVAVGEDPADAIIMLLTAAAHIASKYSDKPPTLIADALADCLGDAILAARDFFPASGPK